MVKTKRTEIRLFDLTTNFYLLYIKDCEYALLFFLMEKKKKICKTNKFKKMKSKVYVYTCKVYYEMLNSLCFVFL